MPLKRAAILAAVVFVLTGCEQIFDQLAYWLWGRETNIAVISKVPVELSPTPVRLDVRQPAKIVGRLNYVCFSLRGDLPLGPTDAMTAEYETLMHGASLTVVATTGTGESITLKKPVQAWSKFGKVEKSSELSTCTRISDNQSLPPVGAVITRIEVSSTVPLQARGVYWESTNAFDMSGWGDR